MNWVISGTWGPMLPILFAASAVQAGDSVTLHHLKKKAAKLRPSSLQNENESPPASIVLGGPEALVGLWRLPHTQGY